MSGPDGLVAYIITVHQVALLLSALLGLIAVVPYAVAVRRRLAAHKGRALLLFAGVTLIFYVFITWQLGVRAVSVEVVKIHGDPPADPS